MTSYIGAELRRFVESRASGLCEYCLIHKRDTYLGCQVDHVVSEKHGGETAAGNLAFACTFCNRAKGSDIGSLASAGEFVRFFNPRSDNWSDHFSLEGELIVAKSAIGEATCRILGFNLADRLLERASLVKASSYPSPEAVARIGLAAP